MPQIPKLGLSGISGIGQSSSAVQNLFARASGAGRALRGAARTVTGGKKRRSSKKKRAVSAAGSRKSSGSKKGKYNSAAWMAKIRKMRKK